jgi:COMPASS component SWD1
MTSRPNIRAKELVLTLGSLKFVVSLFEDQPLYVDATDPLVKKYALPSAPKRPREDDPEKVAEHELSDAKIATTVTVFSPEGKYIISGTNKGWLNIIKTETRVCVYSLSVCTGVVIYLRLSASGRDVVINAQDRIVRTLTLPNLAAKDLDEDTIAVQIEHKFQDVVNKLSWNHVAFSSNGDYVTATTYNNHDIYIWERQHGSLVKILEGPKEEHGVVEWHPHRPLIAACGLESGRVNIWSIVPQQRWSALAPDFVEVEENVEYEEHEDEFDIHPQEEIHKRRLDLEDEDVDVLTIEPIKGGHMETENPFRMPVQLDYVDSESEEEFVAIGRGEMRRKSPTEGRDYGIDGGDGGTSAAEDNGDGRRRRTGRS